MRRQRLSTGALCFLCAAIVCAPAKAAVNAQLAATSQWKVVASPDAGSQAWGNVFYAAADLSPSNAWAVGAAPHPSAYLTIPLAEHWNGTKWSVVSTPFIGKPTAQFNSIAAIANNDVWAAGYSDNPSCLCGEPIVERWNGTAWLRLATPTAGIATYVNSMSVLSDSDVWVAGYYWPGQSYDRPLIMHYNGSRWSLIAPPFVLGQLYSIYATAASDAWAFGYYDNGVLLALHWNGRAWSQVPFPVNSGEIVSMSGAAANDVWAVGGFYGRQNPHALIFHWNGQSWKEVYIAGVLEPSWYYSVSAVASNNVWLVGFGMVYPQWAGYVSNVTYHWNGTQWTDVYNPDQIGTGQLLGVGASKSGDAWAVGHGGYFASVKGTFAMHHLMP